MVLNKSKGDMYPWVDFTHNIIRGECPHQCGYCYLKRFKVGKLRLEKKELKINLGNGKTIFVGSATDMFAQEVPKEWIKEVLEYCKKFDNTYLFQTKNPERFFDFSYPKKVILGTTIETNRDYGISEAPAPIDRYWYMRNLPDDFRKMISIEPIMDFNLDQMIFWMERIKPEFVSIGADSKNHKLPEPDWEDVELLIDALKKFTEVKVKKNLKRLKKEK